MGLYIRRYGRTLLVILAFIVIYELLTDVFGILSPVIFPGLPKVLRALINSLPELVVGLGSSLWKLIPSYLLALVLGIGGGLVLAQNEGALKTMMPIINGLSPIPATLYTTYAIYVFPTFLAASRFIIFIGCFWRIINGTINGVVMIEKNYLNSARTLELKNYTLLRKVILPGALPHILTGARGALNASFLLLIVAELFGASSGLGYFVQYYSDWSKFDNVLAGIIFMAAFIIIIMQSFDALKSYLLRWKD